MHASFRALLQRAEIIWARTAFLPRVAVSIALGVVIIAVAIFALRSPAPRKTIVTTRTVPAAKHIARAAPPKAKPKSVAAKPATAAPSDFDKEELMSFSQRMNRWNPFITEAARRFGVPQPWIRAVMQAESGGRTMLVPNQKITSSAGAMGLMQLMPTTYNDMRRQYGLGTDPYDPHDNILAGAAYLSFLRSKYPYPAMFAAYNDGPGNLEARLVDGGLLPAETQTYVGHITNTLENGGAGGGGVKVNFTRPNGTSVAINAGAVISVRASFPGEYAPGVQSVITVGRVHQGVRESLARAKAIIRAHGGGV